MDMRTIGVPRLGGFGLRWRLAGWVAVVMLACMGVVFFAVYRGTGIQVRRQIDAEIASDASEFAHGLTLAGPRDAQAVAQAATRYVRAQPFAASSTFLFALTPGATTSTNLPELFGDSPPDNGESVAEQARENRLAARLLTSSDGYTTLLLPDLGEMRLFKRSVHLVGVAGHGEEVVIGVAESLAAVTRAQQGVARAFILAGLLALAGALLGAYLIGSRLSRPLRRMAAVAERVDAGDLAPRIDPQLGHGNEIRVLADSFNHMLDRLTEAFAGQRAFVADASHELRTPLTVIRGQLEVLATQAEPAGEEVRRVERLVQAEVARIGRLVDDLLLLAKSERAQSLHLESIELHAFVEGLWQANTLLATRRFELGDVPRGTLRADPDRLAQALRNLLTNAIAHTAPEQGLVRMCIQQVEAGGGVGVVGGGVGVVGREMGVAGGGFGVAGCEASVAGGELSVVGGEFGVAERGLGVARHEVDVAGHKAGIAGRERRIVFIVEDDGPGIPPDQREHVFDRFHRTDAARDRASGGTGLGLAIVHAIVKAHGGCVCAGESAAGGARIELELPHFTPAPNASPALR
jgi:signal transduction histidine kinase